MHELMILPVLHAIWLSSLRLARVNEGGFPMFASVVEMFRTPWLFSTSSNPGQASSRVRDPSPPTKDQNHDQDTPLHRADRDWLSDVRE